MLGIQISLVILEFSGCGVRIARLSTGCVRSLDEARNYTIFGYCKILNNCVCDMFQPDNCLRTKIFESPPEITDKHQSLTAFKARCGSSENQANIFRDNNCIIFAVTTSATPKLSGKF